MAAFADDLALERTGPGAYAADLKPHWNAWSITGGYLGAVAFCAIDEERRLPEPASFHCHYIRPARPGVCEIQVEWVRRSATAELLQAKLVQDDKTVLVADAVMVAANIEGYRHDYFQAPAAASPEELKSFDELAFDYDEWPSLWRNLEVKPLKHRGTPAPQEPVFQAWARLRNADRLSFREAVARQLIFADIAPFYALANAHEWVNQWIAPNLDLHVQFQDLAADESWLVVDATARQASRGLVATTTNLWSRSGKLLAVTASQLISRANPAYEQELQWLEEYKRRAALEEVGRLNA